MNKAKHRLAIEYIENHTDNTKLLLSETVRYLIADLALNVEITYTEAWGIVEEYFLSKHNKIFENVKVPSNSYKEHLTSPD